MATITAGDFRNGKTFEMDGKIMQVVEFQHVKPGKGAAFVRTKMKNIVTGAVTETSFNPTAKFEEAFVERKDMAYSYNDGDLYYFMDQETFDMVPLGKDLLGDAFRFITENTVCKVLSYKGTGQSGRTDFHALVRAQHQHVEADLAVHFLVQLFHIDNVPLGHAILLATGYDHSVHGKAPPE